MGLFSRTPAPNPQGGARARQLYFERNGSPVPSINALPEQAAGLLGVGMEDIDQMKALIAAHNLFTSIADGAAAQTGHQGLRADIDAVVASVGFDDDAIWDAVFALGPKGVAVAEHVVAGYFSTGAFAQAVADHLAENGGVESYVQLPDPGLEMPEPAQLAWRIMSDLGLYYIVSGAGRAHDLVDAVAGVLGDDRLETAAPMFGQIGEDLKWCVYEGEAGAAFVLLPIVDGGADLGPLMQIVDALESLPAPWTTALGKKDAFVPAAAAGILRDGSLVPLETLDALADPAVRGQRRAIRASIVDGGFEPIGTTLFKGVLPGIAERTQLLWIGIGDRLRILSPILEAEAVPDWLTAHDFGRYELELIPPFVTLGLWVDYEVGVEGLRAEALALARYADECEASLAGAGSDAL